MLQISQLQAGKYQPRKDMSQDALEDLANSIKAQGVIQPIVVRPLAENRYEIIAGERRWRASQLAQLAEVPCLIKDVPDEAAVAIALIENIQREDLNAMEEAVALQRLLTEFELTHQQVADAVGKSRAAVSNLLRLNQLNDDVKLLLEHGDIEMGHARALLALDGDAQSDAARLVAAKQLTVRDTENLVRRILEPLPEKAPREKDPDVLALEHRLSERFAAPVLIDQAIARMGLQRKVALKIPNFIGAALVVEHTDLVITIPSRLAEVLRDRGELRSFPVPFALPGYQVKQHWHERYHQDPGSRWLRQVIAELLQAPAPNQRARA